MSSQSERITKLEMELSHLSRLYEQLNEVVTEQATVVDGQQTTIKRLVEQVKKLKESSESDLDPLDEKPPHY